VSTEPVPIREAATVAVVRDHDGALEVFMLRRSGAATFSPGAHVFPGGAVDPADRHRDLERCCDGLDDEAASAALGVPAGGLGYFVAAIRECFEEAGLLLGRRDGELVGSCAPYQDLRAALNTGEASMLDVCRAASVTLAVDLLVPFGHWITPAGAPRRFDTRFFVAPAPAGQDALHDGCETTEGRWMRPVDVLAAADRGELELIRPTRHTLRELARHRSSVELFATT